MPVRSMLGEHLDQRQLHLGQQPGGLLAVAGQLGVERVGQVERGPGAQHQVLLGRAVVAEPVEGELAGLRRVDPQLAVQVAQRQVGQVVGALVGPGQVGGERGVAGEPAQLPAVRGERQQRRLGVVQHLGPARVGQPGRRPRRSSAASSAAGSNQAAGAAGGGQRDAGERAGAAAEPVPADRDADRRAGRRRASASQPASAPARRARSPVEVEAGLGLRLDRLEVLVEPVAQDPELAACRRPGAPPRGPSRASAASSGRSGSSRSQTSRLIS